MLEDEKINDFIDKVKKRHTFSCTVSHDVGSKILRSITNSGWLYLLDQATNYAGGDMHLILSPLSDYRRKGAENYYGVSLSRGSNRFKKPQYSYFKIDNNIFTVVKEEIIMLEKLKGN